MVVYGCGEEGERWSVGGLAMDFGFVGGELGCMVRCRHLWKWKVEMSMSQRRENKAGSGSVDCTRHHKCEGDGNYIGKKRITFVVTLKMSDSPKSKL